MDDKRRVLFGVGDEQFSDGLHVCHLFNDDAERVRTRMRFIERGLEAGDKVLCLVEETPPSDVISALTRSGVDIVAAKDRFAAAVAGDTYCPDGRFAPDTLLNGFRGFVMAARAEGYAGARITGDMSWVLRLGIGLPQLFEYEIKVRQCIRNIPCTAVCEYDARKFDGGTIMDILSVHPAMIVGGQIVWNPHYMEPDEFLRRFNSRREGTC